MNFIEYVLNNYVEYDSENRYYILFDICGNIIDREYSLIDIEKVIKSDTSYWETMIIE